MGKVNAIKDKSFLFAVEIVKLCRVLSDEKKEYVISKQLLRSGTAIGALYREAEHAESRADFIHKLSISLKECNETLYWLDLLEATDYLTSDAYKLYWNSADELMRLLVSIVKSAKGN